MPLSQAMILLSQGVTLQDPFAFAAKRVGDYLAAHHCKDDPQDLLWASLLVKFDERAGHPRDLLGAKLSSVMTLPQAMLCKRQMAPDSSQWWTPRIGRRLPWSKQGPDIRVLDTSIGIPEFAYTYDAIYRRTVPQVFTRETQMPLGPLDFSDFVWGEDIFRHYQTHVDQFWTRHEATYPWLMKGGLLRATLHQQREQSLSREHSQLVLRALGQPVELEWNCARYADFRDRPFDPNVSIQLLKVYRYLATDIMVIREHGKDDVVLYIPGNSSPLHGFTHEDRLREWLVEQCRDERKRASLAGHFSAFDRIDGGIHYGVNTVLRSFAVFPQTLINIGRWSPQYYITFAEPLQNSPFKYFAAAIKARSYADGNQQIGTRKDYYLNEAVEGLDALVMLVGGVCLVVPTLLPLMLALSTAQAGVGVAQMVMAKNAEQSQEGAGRAVFGLLNAAGSAGSWLLESALAKDAASRVTSGLKEVSRVAKEQLWHAGTESTGEVEAQPPLWADHSHVFPALPELPLAAALLPANVHLIRLGDEALEDDQLAALQALKQSGLHVTLHIDGDPGAFQQAHAGIVVERLQDKPFFRDFIEGPGAEACRVFSQLGLVHEAHEVLKQMLRYGLIHALGGIYLDPDVTLNAWPREGVRAGAYDILLARPDAPTSAGGRRLYRNSVLASHPGNPLLVSILDTGLQRLADVAAMAITEDIPGALSDAVGLGLFNDMLELYRPDYYGLAMVSTQLSAASAAFQARFRDVLDFYFPFRAEGRAPVRAG